MVKSKLTSALSSLMNHKTPMIKSTATASRRTLSGIEDAIAKSTGGDERLTDDRHVNKIIFLVSNSPGSITFLAKRISARLEASRDAAAALKSLALLHRLLRAGDRFFEQDLRLLWSSGDLGINVPRRSCDSFVSSYSLFLQERIEWLMNQAGKLEPAQPRGFDRKLKAGELALYNVTRCQVLLDRVMACSPENNGDLSQDGQKKVAMFVLDIIVRESFGVYDTFCDGIEKLVASFFSIGRAGASAAGVLRKTVMQAPKLQEFYDCCKRVIARKKMEYPLVRIVITEAEISSLEKFATAAAADDALDCEKKPRHGGGWKEEEEEEKGSNALSEKMETKISTVWVEFSDGESSDVLITDHDPLLTK